MKTILVLGGTQMLGRNFVESIDATKSFDITIANRGITNSQLFNHIKHITIDRNFLDKCSSISGVHYDYVIDFSCYNIDQFRHVIEFISCDRYILISTQSVFDEHTLNSNNYSDPYFLYTLNKKNLETYASSLKKSFKLLVVRPCAIYGEHDYTHRFEKKNGIFYWIGTSREANKSTGCMELSVFTNELIKQLDSILNQSIEYINIGP